MPFTGKAFQKKWQGFALGWQRFALFLMKVEKKIAGSKNIRIFAANFYCKNVAESKWEGYNKYLCFRSSCNTDIFYSLAEQNSGGVLCCSCKCC